MADPAHLRYSPSRVTGMEIFVRTGDPAPEGISTSYVERQNLTMRMGMRRFTRLTNGFSRKVENLAAAVAIHFMYYNFGRTHQTLKTTPAMAAGIADHRWSLVEIAALLDAPAASSQRPDSNRPTTAGASFKLTRSRRHEVLRPITLPTWPLRRTAWGRWPTSWA